MVSRVDVYIITKEEGTLLSKFSLLNMTEEPQDHLISGFLSALNSFAKEIGFPRGVSLIRSGNLEARFAAGEYVYSVLIIDYSQPLGLMTEPIIGGLARDIVDRFEAKFQPALKKGKEKRLYKTDDYTGAKEDIVALIDKYGNETFELYQKLILIEAMYTKVPQKWIMPLLEKVSSGKSIVDGLDEVPEMYQKQLQRAIAKINYNNAPIWEIFAIPLIEGSF